MEKIQIKVDSREKKNQFLFRSYQDVEVVHGCLKTGDYSLIGFEDKITIDRKATSGELQICFGKDWTRFKAELDRMSTFEEAYIMCTFPESDLAIFPRNSGIPTYRWRKLRASGKFLIKRCHDIEKQYPNVRIIFTESNIEAELYTYKILRNYYEEKYNTNR